VPLETRYRKYEQQGFSTPSGKLEIFSTALQGIGQSPLPEFRAPRLDPTSKFPLVLTSAKTPIYCHSQHRNLPRLRRVIPDPVVEINPATAALHEIEQDEWVSISTPRGSVRARAHLNASLADGVIGGQHGWWQSCPDLGLPGYDPLGSDGANINLVIGDEVLDPVSGAAPHRAYPCQLHKLDD
jgi:anaerobic selenocysteine-containing dehydrogenase